MPTAVRADPEDSGPRVFPSGRRRNSAEKREMHTRALVPPRRRLIVWAGILALVAVGTPWLQRENFFSEGGETTEAVPMPPLSTRPADWIGCEPLTADELRGRVWVLDCWTFGCVNCLRSLPYANDMVERFGPEVGVLGIHSPEFDQERNLDLLRASIREHGVRFPTYVDASLDAFLALGAQAWPAFYVVDRQSRIRGRWFGEVHEGTFRAREIEALIRKLLAE